MGDCIMAFWNAPLDDADHALHAVEAAEAMLAAMPEVNRAIEARLPYRADGAHVRIGIGINSGECVIGNMGSAKRFDYSVLGDAVNIAARLESLCKTYDVPVIIGNGTVERIGKGLAFHQLDEIAVRGRSETQAIFTLG
jgi:adenylate cyclase